MFAYCRQVFIFNNFSVGVQPSVKKQLKKYISLRVQCFAQLEIFLPEQLKKYTEKNLPMRTTLHLNQSNNSISLITSMPKCHIPQQLQDTLREGNLNHY